jgi:hypothetical protein
MYYVISVFDLYLKYESSLKTQTVSFINENLCDKIQIIHSKFSEKKNIGYIHVSGYSEKYEKGKLIIKKPKNYIDRFLKKYC